jgi:hypothetical protein
VISLSCFSVGSVDAIIFLSPSQTDRLSSQNPR